MFSRMREMLMEYYWWFPLKPKSQTIPLRANLLLAITSVKFQCWRVYANVHCILIQLVSNAKFPCRGLLSLSTLGNRHR